MKHSPPLAQIVGGHVWTAWTVEVVAIVGIALLLAGITASMWSRRARLAVER